MHKKKAPPIGTEEPTKGKSNGQCSCKDYTTLQDSRQVSELLRHGADNATTAREIASFLGWPVRTVTEQMQRERLSGSPILASCDSRNPGYYLASNAGEVDDYLNRLAHREREIQRTRAAVAATRQQHMTFAGGD